MNLIIPPLFSLNSLLSLFFVYSCMVVKIGKMCWLDCWRTVV